MALNHQRRAFVNEYLKDFNGVASALRCGQTPASAATFAWRMLMDVEVIAAIEEKQAERAAAADISAEWVLRQWKEIASADPNEIIWHENECCRYCYGVGHNYQWTKWEFARAVETAAAHRCGSKCGAPCEHRIPPDGSGGFDYTPHKPPIENCPVCHGRGLARVCIADTRRLTGSARRLYAGVKTTQNGVEVKMRDQDAALKNIAQYLGMLIDRKEIAGTNGRPLSLVNVDVRDLTTEQLLQVMQQCLLADSSAQTIEGERT